MQNAQTEDRSFYGEPYMVDEVYTDNKDAVVKCQGCDWEGPVSETEPIEQCALTIGDPSPAGRCPDEDCRACCYLKDKLLLDEAAPDLLAAIRAILFQVVQGPVLERDACITQARAAYLKAGGGN